MVDFCYVDISDLLRICEEIGNININNCSWRVDGNFRIWKHKEKEMYFVEEDSPGIDYDTTCKVVKFDHVPTKEDILQVYGYEECVFFIKNELADKIKNLVEQSGKDRNTVLNDAIEEFFRIMENYDPLENLM